MMRSLSRARWRAYVLSQALELRLVTLRGARHKRLATRFRRRNAVECRRQ